MYGYDVHTAAHEAPRSNLSGGSAASLAANTSIEFDGIDCFDKPESSSENSTSLARGDCCAEVCLPALARSCKEEQQADGKAAASPCANDELSLRKRAAIAQAESETVFKRRVNNELVVVRATGTSAASKSASDDEVFGVVRDAHNLHDGEITGSFHEQQDSFAQIEYELQMCSRRIVRR